MNCFCTIITKSHLPYARALYSSLKEHGDRPIFYVLVTDSIDIKEIDDQGFKPIFLSQLENQELIHKLSDKYKLNSNEFRWSMKPVLLLHLLQFEGYNKVFFLDPDLYFFSSYKYLEDELGDSSFLLSPNWKTMNPYLDEAEFFTNFTDGLYNAGFLGVTRNGIETLIWWANMCLYACERHTQKPLNDDQAYLNLFPIRNPDTKIITHKGCNVAVWNMEECKRNLQEDGTVFINNTYPIIFIHFSHTFDLYFRDKLIVPYLEIYANSLIKHGLNFNIIESANNYSIRQQLRRLNLLQRIKRKLFIFFKL